MAGLEGIDNFYEEDVVIFIRQKVCIGS